MFLAGFSLNTSDKKFLTVKPRSGMGSEDSSFPYICSTAEKKAFHREDDQCQPDH